MPFHIMRCWISRVRVYIFITVITSQFRTIYIFAIYFIYTELYICFTKVSFYQDIQLLFMINRKFETDFNIATYTLANRVSRKRNTQRTDKQKFKILSIVRQPCTIPFTRRKESSVYFSDVPSGLLRDSIATVPFFLPDVRIANIQTHTYTRTHTYTYVQKIM